MVTLWANHKFKKNYHFKTSFSLILWNNHKPFFDYGLNCDMGWKVGFILQPAVTSSVVGPRGSFKTIPKVKVASKKRVMVTVWWSAIKSDPRKLSESQWNHYLLRSMLSKWMRCPENCSAHSWLCSTERAQFFSMTMPSCTWHNQHFKSWMNWATKFCFICHIHLTSRQQTITSSSISTTFCWGNASITSRMKKMLSKSLLNPKAWIFMLQE